MKKAASADITFIENVTLQELIKRKGYSISTLAPKLNMTRQRLSRLLKDNSLLTISTLEQICSIIGSKFVLNIVDK